MSRMTSNTVKNRIRDLKGSGVSYAEIARSLGVNRSTVMRWAKGQTRPTLSKNQREKIYRKWRKAPKSLRNSGANVSLDEYFKRVWYDSNGLNLPLNYRPIPNYDFPNQASVRVLAVFNASIVDEGGFSKDEYAFQITLNPNQNIALAVQNKFFDWFNKAQTSFTRILRVERERVLLQWLK